MEDKSRQTELFTRARRGEVVMMRHFSSVKKGLVTEAHSRPHHIDWALGAIDIQLRLFKRQIDKPPNRTAALRNQKTDRKYKTLQTPNNLT